MDYFSEIEQEKKNRRRGIIISLLFHLFLLLLLWWIGLPYLYPPPPDEGILVNFGTMEVGKGDHPSEVLEEVKDVTPVEPPITPPVESEQKQEEVITQEEEVTVTLPKKEETQKEIKKEIPQQKEVPLQPAKEPVREEPPKEEPKVNQRALFTGKRSDRGHPNNQGIAEGKGDQGASEGDPNALNYGEKSFGKGDAGIGYDLGGRGKVALPLPEYNSQETGTVVIKIQVDRSGNVVAAIVEPKGTTTTSNVLKSAALNAARKSRFTADPNAPEIQFGTITYTFKVQ